MGYAGTTGYGVVGYGDLVHDINSEYEDDSKRKYILVNIVGRYDQIKALISDSKQKISGIDDNLIKMKEIEKRLEKQLKS